MNGVGGTATGVVTVVVAYTKFAEGAWLVTVAIPLLVLACSGCGGITCASRGG